MNFSVALSEPEIDEADIQAVVNVLRSKWLSMGEVTAAFERRFADKMGVKHAFAVTNCTAALHLANIAVGVGPGDEVICPALTFIATANATLYVNGKVVFADVTSPHDLTVSPDDIEAKITPRTRAITVVHYGGFACDMDRIVAIARAHRLKVIEDCAHAPFAQYRFATGARYWVGAIGDVGCFSFFANKNMTTGEGGMITTNDDEIAARIRLLRSHGMTQLTYDRHKGHATGYDVVALGYNYRIDEIRAAIGLSQLAKIDSIHCRRREVFRWYTDELADFPHITVPFRDRVLEDATPHIMTVLVNAGAGAVRAQLRTAGIQTSRHYEPVPNFTAFRNTTRCQISISPATLVTLPLSASMTREVVVFVCDSLKQACSRATHATVGSPSSG